MIAFLRGILAETLAESVIIDVGGVGFEVLIHNLALQKMPEKGEEVVLFTAMQVGENVLRLFGFLERRELELFKILTSISGLGPKTAMAVLGHFDPERFFQVVVAQDLKTITTVPGVGKKTGERILFELKDRVAQLPASSPVVETSSRVEELLEALQALGYSRSEVYPDVLSLLEQNELGTLEEGIKKVLKARAASRSLWR